MIDMTADPQAEVDPQDQTAADPTAQMSPEQRLAAIKSLDNFATDLDAQELSKIGKRVVDEYNIDVSSRAGWLERTQAAMDLAVLVSEEKNYPFKGAANVKYPLVTTAALQFNARAYPAIVPGDRVVKCKTRGQDPRGEKAARAERVSEHMSDQLLNEMPEWERDTDRLTIIVPITGCVFRKSWYDPSVKRNVSRLVTADNLVLNYGARSIQDAPRFTEKLHLYPYEIQERIRDGRFIQFDYEAAGPGEDDEGKGDSKSEPDAQTSEDDDAPHLFLEQHRLLDLDEDDYPEPYIVTVHKASDTVVRVVANWSPDTVTFAQDGKIAAIRRLEYFTQYDFLPNPEGGVYGWGFGWLLKDINETINTTLNQMLDAGHLSNIQGGLVSSVLGIKEKSIRLEKGEWRVLNTNMPLNQAVMPIKYDGPSATLFNLLGQLVDAGKEMAAVKDVLTGDTPATAPVGTTLALIEQGLQVFTSIYKRIHRALKFELGIYQRLNRDNVDPQAYAEFFDAEQPFDPKADYDSKDMGILPVSDPQAVTKMQKLAKAQLVMEVGKENPFVNQEESLRRFFAAADVEDIDKLMAKPPEPDPEQVAMMKLAAKLGLEKTEAEVMKTITEALLALATAGAQEVKSDIAHNQLVLKTIETEIDGETAQNGQGLVPGMEGQPGDAMGAQAPGGAGNAGSPAVAGPAMGGSDPSAGGLGAATAPGGLPPGAL